MAKRKRRVLARILWGVLILVVLAIIGVVVWSQVGVSQPEAQPLDEAERNPAITISEREDSIVVAPSDGGSDVGLVFIPGAKVAPEAYIPLFQDVVADGTAVVITRPWLNLAFFDPRPLDAFTAAAPDVDEWLVGGHSLGGVRACMLAPEADGLVLFASYCATDLSGTDLPVLSLAGSEDGLSTPEKIADARHLLPADSVLEEIPGASHASFGMYGPQAGDGTPSITDARMIEEVAERLDAFLATIPPGR